MTDKPVVLTAEQASALLTYDPSIARPQLHNLATGRTRVIVPLTEDECRAAFEAHWCPPDYDEAPGFEVHKQFAWDAWLACARAMGAVR